LYNHPGQSDTLAGKDDVAVMRSIHSTILVADYPPGSL